MKKNNSILVVGSVALDTIGTPFGKEKDILGGSATYFSISAANFTPVNLVAVIGQDFPDKYQRLLKRKNIDLRGLVVEKGKTFRWQGDYGWDFSDPQTIATHLNVFGRFDPQIPSVYRASKYVFLANIDPNLQERVLGQVKRPKLIVADTMNYWIENEPKALLKLLKRVDISLLNESEAKQLTKEANLIKAGKKIMKFGPKIVIIKKGEHGVMLFSKNNIFATPAFLLESIVDPTGAGDTFAGGFIGYLATCAKFNQTSLRKAIVYGAIMATFAVEDFSVKRLCSVTRADIGKRIKQFRKFTCF
jgi:sugar/nucleoside kinase (ribokinase family)